MEFGSLFRTSQGMDLSIVNDRGEVRNILDNWNGYPDIIVVTDGSRILGLGDLGINGMGIPIGKLSLYVAAAGFHPGKTLPITLAVGTNTQKYLDDPCYLGTKIKRVRDKEFYEFVDEFLKAVKDKWPNCLVQFEDFSNDVCFDLLEIHRNKILCFNDDIQGTGAVVLAGFLNAIKLQGIELMKQKIVFHGAGSASTGVATYIAQLMKEYGAKDEEIYNCFYLVDSRGLVTDTRGDKLEKHKESFSRKDFKKDQQLKTLFEVVKVVKPTTIIGLSGQGGAFSEELVKEMSKHVEKPIIFPLSNPTNKSECTATEAYTWTDGKCIFASGSPFDEVKYKDKIYIPGQGNNMYIFPGLGMGSVISKSKKVTDGMILESAKTLASSVTKEELEVGRIYPDLARIRKISFDIIKSVCERSVKEGLSQVDPLPKDWSQIISDYIYYPDYPKEKN